jgi:hemoglobin
MVPLMAWIPSREDSPFHRLGEERARALAARFYDHMDATEPELARLHELDGEGKVSSGTRERFAHFLVEWLGGPNVYSSAHGHPRLRMRHAKVKVDDAMRGAWIRCMQKAMDDLAIEGELRTFLDGRFAEVASFLVNHVGG